MVQLRLSQSFQSWLLVSKELLFEDHLQTLRGKRQEEYLAPLEIVINHLLSWGEGGNKRKQTKQKPQPPIMIISMVNGDVGCTWNQRRFGFCLPGDKWLMCERKPRAVLCWALLFRKTMCQTLSSDLVLGYFSFSLLKMILFCTCLLW